mmetsp:Transcript_88626/g.246644  ORF Transcript_88626/g.246644 Transcript_88626/m.246644 type:complete len:224 (-) Transcript_88626:37-708(-)
MQDQGRRHRGPVGVQPCRHREHLPGRGVAAGSRHVRCHWRPAPLWGRRGGRGGARAADGRGSEAHAARRGPCGPLHGLAREGGTVAELRRRVPAARRGRPVRVLAAASLELGLSALICVACFARLPSRCTYFQLASGRRLPSGAPLEAHSFGLMSRPLLASALSASKALVRVGYGLGRAAGVGTAAPWSGRDDVRTVRRAMYRKSLAGVPVSLPWRPRKACPF